MVFWNIFNMATCYVLYKVFIILYLALLEVYTTVAVELGLEILIFQYQYSKGGGGCPSTECIHVFNACILVL